MVVLSFVMSSMCTYVVATLVELIRNPTLIGPKHVYYYSTKYMFFDMAISMFKEPSRSPRLHFGTYREMLLRD